MAINSNCYIISILGGKGGVGKSVFASNLAFATALELRTPTLLFDFDQKSCGDQNFINGFQKPKTLEDLCNFTGSISSRNLSAVLNIHPQAPVHYVAAVRGPGQIFLPNAGLAMRQIETLSNFYKYIILDLGNDIDELQAQALDISTLILTVTTPEILTVNQTLRIHNELAAATIPQQMVQVVVNKFNKSGLAVQSIEQTLRKKVLGVIPQDDVTAMGALKRGAPFVLTTKQAPVSAAHHAVVRTLSGGMLQKLKMIQKPTTSFKKKDEDSEAAPTKRNQVDPRTHLKLTIHRRLIKDLNLKNDDITKAKQDPDLERKLQNDVKVAIAKILDQESKGVSATDRRQIIKEVMDEALGLGPLEELLVLDSVSEIMVNGFDKIFIEKNGKIQLSRVHFTSNVQLRNVIERIVTPLGRRIDEKTPYVDARLEDGSRVNAVIEPLSIDGPALTIRKFRKESFGVEQYIEYNSCSKQMMDFLKLCVAHGKNIIISGGTGSGKTTLLNCMSTFIPSDERIITVEDAAELQLKQEHVVRLETRPANMEGTGAITIRDLVKNSLRMRPDRIVVGECRDGAALDMLSAMNTGHDGSMTTVHSNNPREAISRLETLCMMAGMDLPAKAIREQIAGAVDLIVQISRLSDGSRKVMNITEVQGIQGEAVTLQDVFAFKETGFDKNRKIVGQFLSKGLIPKFVQDLKERGIIIPKDLFSNEQDDSSQSMKAPRTDRMRRPQKKVGGKS
ncbi:MAG: Flp pilus assembly complex ATPase component TadA [Bdellovibrionales bacterium]|nr:Flp pilus assembly complex ATPase component TadA [Bdellovibrionales bacterium]